MLRQELTKVFSVLASAIVVMAGCSGGDAELSKAEDTALRGKMDEGLSPAEIEKHFGKDYMQKNAQGGPGAPAAPREKGK